MMKWFLILFTTCACSNLQAQVIINTIAGQGKVSGYTGDGGPGTNAKLDQPQMICLDKFGNIYFADANNNRVRKIDAESGIITTIAGNGTAGYSGDGGQGTNAQLLIPTGVTSDTGGNIYLSDALNRRIRKIDALTGIITTVAGNGTMGNSGDGGQATNAQINAVTGLCTDKSNNIYIVDIDNNNVRKINGTTGIITRVAGTGVAGYSGDGQVATDATLNQPCHPFIDNAGNLFVTDLMNNVVRRVNASDGIITTIAGTGVAGYSGDDGLAINAKLKQPYGICVDKQNNIFIAEYLNGVIRKIDGVSGIITTVAGIGTQGFSGDGGPATNSQMAAVAVCVDHHGSIFISDYGNHVIRKVYDSSQHYTQVRSITKNEVKIHPNPVGDELTIEGVEGAEINICNVVGQSFYKLKVTKNKEHINVGTLVSGVYLLQAVDGSTGLTMTRRFVKQ